MAVLKWESFLEDKIEGFFNHKFAGTLEPSEIIKGLEREVARAAAAENDEILAPNRYRVLLNDNNYQKFCAKRVQDVFYTSVVKQIIRCGYFAVGNLQVEVIKSRKISSQAFAVESTFTDPTEAATSETSSSDTIVLGREKDFPVPLNLPMEHKFASLTVIEGIDADSSLAIGERQIYIGRRDKSDFILTDDSVSRLHAYIAFERCRHVLRDAESTNGTFVNGTKIERCCLENGDEIQMGNTILRYEVI